MNKEAFYRGYTDALARLTKRATNTVATASPIVTDENLPPGPVGVVEPIEGGIRSTTQPTNSVTDASSIVTDENLPPGPVGVIEPKDGDKSEWSGYKGPLYHTVQTGDVLGRIARQFGTTVPQIQQWNGIADPNKIRAGARLRVR